MYKLIRYDVNNDEYYFIKSCKTSCNMITLIKTLQESSNQDGCNYIYMITWEGE